MVKLLVEINSDMNATSISFTIEEEHPTEAEEFWKRRLFPVLKNSLGTATALFEERAKSLDHR